MHYLISKNTSPLKYVGEKDNEIDLNTLSIYIKTKSNGVSLLIIKGQSKNEHFPFFVGLKVHVDNEISTQTFEMLIKQQIFQIELIIDSKNDELLLTISDNRKSFSIKPVVINDTKKSKEQNWTDWKKVVISENMNVKVIVPISCFLALAVIITIIVQLLYYNNLESL